MRHLKLALVFGASLAPSLAPSLALAQNLGGFRQFLSVEPYYVNVQVDNGEGVDRTSLNGIGGRLWINYAPFVRSRTLAKGGIGLFYHRTFSKDDVFSVSHLGAEQDIFVTNRPFGGFIDPVISVGGGAYRYHTNATRVGGVAVPAASVTKFALSPGLGVRVPLPNRFQLRVDGRDAIVFGTEDARGNGRTLHNFEFKGSLGVTF